MSRKVKLVSTGFRLTPDQYATFKRKLPRNGDRSRFLSRVVELFNDGRLRVIDYADAHVNLTEIDINAPLS